MVPTNQYAIYCGALIQMEQRANHQLQEKARFVAIIRYLIYKFLAEFFFVMSIAFIS